jgi:hypothetical protein
MIATTGMDYAVICLLISYVMHELGQHNESRNLFYLAINKLHVSGHFWRRGMGIYWFNFVWPKLSHLKGPNMLCLVRQGAGVCLAEVEQSLPSQREGFPIQEEMLLISAINWHSSVRLKPPNRDSHPCHLTLLGQTVLERQA